MQAKLKLILPALLCLLLAACGAPADDSTSKLVAALDKHTALLKEGNFKVEDFEAETKPILDEMEKHRNPDSKRIEVTEPVQKEFQRATAAFVAATEEKSDIVAMLAWQKVQDKINGGAEPPKQ